MISKRFVGSNPTPRTLPKLPVFREYLLSNRNLAIVTIDRRVKLIRQLSKYVDLFDSDKVVKFLNESKWSNGTKNLAIQAYNDFQIMYNLKPTHIKKYHITQKLPFVPLEKEIDQLISGFTRKTSAFLFLLKETGIRPIEAWSLEWSDIDTQQNTVNIRTAKHGIPRILPISERLINILFSLNKKESKYIFAISDDIRRFNRELSHFTRNYIDRRREISKNLSNKRLILISLYTFRHWKATTLYLQTRDIFHVKWWLGHSRIENTMKYVHVANAVVKDTGSYTSKVAKTEDEVCILIDQGFEYVCDLNGSKIFRKRK